MCATLFQTFNDALKHWEDWQLRASAPF